MASAALLLLTSTPGLLNTCWSLDIDLGQERGSWMPPKWGLSGARARATPVVQFAEEGKLKLLGGGPWDRLQCRWLTDDEDIVGGWEVANERATFYLEHDGIERGDVVLEPGRVYASAGAWGSLLQKRGTLTIKQRKFGWMPFLPTANEASFIVGVFTATAAQESEATASMPIDFDKK